MAKEVSIFSQSGAVSTVSRREPSELAKALAAGSTTRRIQTNTNGTFRRLINGEQVGDAVRGSIDVIIVHALSKVSRIYYENEYDPDAKPTLPNCWSNLGDRPEFAVPDPQFTDCADCPKNIVGTGPKGRGRACRYQRRVAILLAGDMSGDVYQFNIPAKSLFGKGVGNVHPFESYHRFLAANKESIDSVVTQISYNLNADSMELQFTPVRGLDDEEIDLVADVQAQPETKLACVLTVAARDGVTTPPTAQVGEEPEEGPKRRSAAPKGATPATRTKLADTIAAFGDAE